MFKQLRLLIFLVSTIPFCAVAEQHFPIIDMHLHAYAADLSSRALCLPLLSYLPPPPPNGSWDKWRPTVTTNPPCSDPIWSPTTEQALIEQTITILRRRNIIGVLSGSPERVRRWRDAAPDRFILGVELEFGPNLVSPDSLRELHKNGLLDVLGEIENQYAGIPPNDKQQMEPYWSLAEELDIPVVIHMGEGRPGAAYIGSPEYRVRLGSPLLLEDVLIHHPKLRVCVMHYGSPLVDEMIAVLQSYPQVYVETGGIQWLYPRPYFYEQLKKFIDAGFGKRVMFGSDQIIWPGLIEPAMAIIDEAPFLSDEQKRDIFYNNAARFLRFSQEEIRKHQSR